MGGASSRGDEHEVGGREGTEGEAAAAQEHRQGRGAAREAATSQQMEIGMEVEKELARGGEALGIVAVAAWVRIERRVERIERRLMRIERLAARRVRGKRVVSIRVAARRVSIRVAPRRLSMRVAPRRGKRGRSMRGAVSWAVSRVVAVAESGGARAEGKHRSRHNDAAPAHVDTRWPTKES